MQVFIDSAKKQFHHPSLGPELCSSHLLQKHWQNNLWRVKHLLKVIHLCLSRYALQNGTTCNATFQFWDFFTGPWQLYSWQPKPGPNGEGGSYLSRFNMTELIRCTIYNGLYVYTYNISIYHILFMRNIYICTYTYMYHSHLPLSLALVDIERTNDDHHRTGGEVPRGDGHLRAEILTWSSISSVGHSKNKDSTAIGCFQNNFSCCNWFRQVANHVEVVLQHCTSPEQEWETLWM